jgi:excisionase family DNA binding protein
MTAPAPDLMTPAQVSRSFGVDPRTVVRWVSAGKLHPVRTPGGIRRYFRAEVEALRNGTPLSAEQVEALLRGEA